MKRALRLGRPAANTIIVRLGRRAGGPSREEWLKFFMSLSEQMASAKRP